MSCYTYEKGDLVIPQTEWEKFKADLHAAFTSVPPSGDYPMPKMDIKAGMTSYRGEEWTVQLHDAGCVFRWAIDEGNWSIERVHVEPMIKAMVKLIKRIAWQPKTGGVIVGDTEGNRSRGKKPYIVAAYGPLANRMKVTEGIAFPW